MIGSKQAFEQSRQKFTSAVRRRGTVVAEVQESRIVRPNIGSSNPYAGMIGHTLDVFAIIGI